MTMPDPSRLRPSDATVRPSGWMTVLICTTADRSWSSASVSAPLAAGTASAATRKSRSHPRSRMEPTRGALRMVLLRRHAQRRRRPQDRGLAEQMLGRDLQRPAEAFRQEQALHPAAEGHRHEALDHHGAKPLAQRLGDRRPAAFPPAEADIFAIAALDQLPADRHFAGRRSDDPLGADREDRK